MILNYLGRTVYFICCSVFIFATYNNCAKPSHTLVNSSSNGSLQEAPFKCTDPNKTSASGSYPLTKVQYQNSIEDLFGATVLSAASNQISTIFDDSFDNDTSTRTSTLSPDLVFAYYNSAQAIATTILNSTALTATVFGSCANTLAPAANCIDTYINDYAKRILRRPLDTDEIAFVQQIMSTPGDYKENLKAVLSYHLQSSQFLWRLETGIPNQSSQSKLLLTPFEVATRLAFQITNSTPDNALLSAAADGSISTPEGLKAQVKRLLLSPRGKKKLVNHLLDWAQADKPNDVSTLPVELTTGVQLSGLAQAMVDEAQAFAEYIVFTKNGSFKDLLTSQLSFASHPGLAAIYNHSPVATTPVNFGDRRQGLLMRAGFLSSTVARTSIIHRGVDFQKKVLCNELKSPTIDIADSRQDHVLSPDELLTVSNRTAITYQTQSPVCMSCHNVINPTGFAFESFDSLGRYRTKEKIFDQTDTLVNQLDIHTTTTVPVTKTLNKDVGDAYDFITYLSEAPAASACFTKKVFRLTYEKVESADDSCQLNESYKIMSDPSKPILEAVEAFFTQKNIYYKETI